MASPIEISIPHSELGPSAADRWLNCPGSVLLVRDFEDEESIYAAEGSAAHELSEWCRRDAKPADHWRGTIIKSGAHEFEVDQEMIDGVNDFVEYVEQWPGDALYEERVFYTEWVPGGFGTLDDGRLQDSVCRVTDLKYGKGVQVFAEWNAQLMMYALGLYHDYRHLYDFQCFILTVHQPRLNHVDVFEIDRVALLSWANDLVRPTAELALKPGAPLKAGDHCKFCPARRVCKVRADYLTAAVFNDFRDLDSGTKEVLFLSNDEISELLPKLSNIKGWCSDLEQHARSEVAKGNPVGDYKLVEGRGSREFVDDAEDSLALIVDDPDVLWEPRKLLSPAKLEKIIGRSKTARASLDGLIKKLPGSPTLVPGKDKRPALEFKAENEFGNLDA